MHKYGEGNDDAMKDKLHRLRKVCRYASNVLTVGYIVLAILAVAIAVLGIWTMIDNNFVDTFKNIVFAPNTETVTLVASCLEAMTVFGVGSATVFITEKIVKSIYSEEHSPFTKENTDRIMMMCYMFLGTSVAMLILEYLARRTITALIVFLGLLFVTVVLYAVKLVFQYGVTLQEESDQTL